jgi:microsomal dipeptidase-like Zn-dependent dipeptidase
VEDTYDNSRNLSDAQLRVIAHTGGVIGIGYFDVADVASEDAVALGSDFDGAVVVPFDTTGLGLLIDALFQAGFTDDEAAKIMGGNALKVLTTSL